MKLRRTLTAAAAVAVSAAALVACGDSGSGSGGSDTVTLWLAGEDTPEEARDWLKNTFEEQNDGYTLDIQTIDWGELLDRLNQALPSEENTPDLVEIGNTQTATYSSIGAFEDLTDRLSDYGDIGPQSFLDAGVADGANYAVPYYWGSRYVFYDKQALSDAGIEVPTTLEEFDAAAVELQQAAGGDYSGLWLPGQDWRNGISWLFAYGGQIAELEGDTWTGQLSSEASIEGLTAWQNVQNNGSSAPVDGLDAEPWVTFNNDEAAMFIAPSWARWSVEEEKADDLGAFALPGVDGGAAPVFAGGSNLAISANSQNKEMANAVLDLIMSDDYQRLLAENGLGPANPEFTDLMGDDEFALAAVAAAENSQLTPASPNWAAIETDNVMEEFFGQIAGGADVTQAAAEADARLDDLLN